MALHGLLNRGIAAVIAEGAGELEMLVRQQGLAPEAAEHIRQVIEAIPGLLVAVDRALEARAEAPKARALFLEVLAYVLLDDNLIPARSGKPVVGLLDDAYFVHRAAQELREHMTEVDMRSIDGAVELLRRVLPASVWRELDERIERAATGAARG